MGSFLSMVSITSRLVAALILSLAYYSLFSFFGRYVDFITTIPVFLMSIVVVEGINIIVRKQYTGETESEIIVHDSADSFAILGKSEKSDDRLEIAIIVLIFSIILFITSYVSVLFGYFTGQGIDVVYQRLMVHAFWVFASYIVALLSLYFILQGKDNMSGFGGKPLYYVLFSVSVGFFSHFLLNSIKLLLGV